MKMSHLLALTTAALIATGSAFAGPNCKDCPKKDSGSDEGVYEVVEREGGEKAEKRDRGERAERGERRDRGERAEGDRKRPERRDRSPLRGLDLTEDQHAQVKEIMAAAREDAKAIMQEVKAKKEAGEEIDRKAVRAQMKEIRKGAMKSVYDNVLTAEQQAKVDERREKMEQRRKARDAEGGERPERDRKGKRDKKDRGGDDDLDL